MRAKVMKLASETHALLTIARFGFKNVFSTRLALLGQFMIYALIVAAYSNVFYHIPPEQLSSYHLTVSQMIWYIAITEMALFCSFYNFLDLQADIQSGLIELSLLRPISVWKLKLAEWLGGFFARFCVLSIPSFIVAGLYAGSFEINFVSVIGIIVSLGLGAIIFLCAHFMVGCATLWLKQSEPAYWLWQKSMFLLGALLWPLVLYPVWLKTIVWITPFPAVLAVTGNWVIGASHYLLIGGFVAQLIWVRIFLKLASLMNKRVWHYWQNEGS